MGVWWACWSRTALQHSDITKTSKEALSFWSVSPAHRGLSEGHRVPPAELGPAQLPPVPSIQGGRECGPLLPVLPPAVVQLWRPRPAPPGTARLAARVECRPTNCGDVVTKVQGMDRRHTLDLQVPSPSPRPPAVGAASGGFRAGNAVHLERGTQESPWVKGGDWGLIRWS